MSDGGAPPINLVEKADETDVGLAAADVIDPAERADELQAHFAFAIRAAEQDDGSIGPRFSRSATARQAQVW